MHNRKLPIRKIVSYLNDEESEGGGFWLPNIQRPFVWTEEQIARLFDSIMREYPISTLLVWKTREVVKHRRFIDSYRKGIKLSDFEAPENRRAKLLVLDGQQRLQSLFLGLKGTYERKALFFDITSGTQAAAPEDIRYRFEFRDPNTALWPWVRFREIVFSGNKLEMEIAEAIEAVAPDDLDHEVRQRIRRNIGRALREFVFDDNITYQELDGVDDPEAYTVDDVVEIFIRANSGGTKLGKSDLLFSLLTSSWEEADTEMEDLLGALNATGFAFDRDFILKTALTLLGKGARYDVARFRDGSTKEEIIQNWPKIADAIKGVRDWLVSNTYIRSDKGLPSYLALIPIVYLRYHYPETFRSAAGLREFVLRALATGAYSGNPDLLIDRTTRQLDEDRGFVFENIRTVLLNSGRTLQVTRESILDQSYTSRAIHLFFNLWYKDFDYSPALSENGPQIDHVFPQSELKKVKTANPVSGKMDLLRYLAQARDQIANCMLLTAEENGFGEKNNTLPRVWFARSRFASDVDHEKYLRMHLIPRDAALWELDNYERFVDARKELIVQHFAGMLRDDG